MLNRAFDHFLRFVNSSVFTLLTILISVYSVAHKSDLHYGWTNEGKRGKTVFVGDGFGYYSYLPQYFIYSDKEHYIFLDSLGEVDPLIRNQWMIPVLPETNYKVNKFFIGTPLAMAPFFLTNHAIQKISHGRTDGYSHTYRFAIFVGAMFYLLLGLLGLINLLRLFSIPNLISSFLVISLLFGTNLTYYAAIEFTMSHLYAFTFCAWFLYFLKRWEFDNRKSSIMWAVFFYSFLILIRPIDGLIILLSPFFFSNWRVFIARIKSIIMDYRLLIGSSCIFLFFISLQLISNKIQFGSFKIIAYSNEGFDYIFNPKIYEILFGYRKGLFVYSPIFLLIIPSLLIIKDRFLAKGSFFVFSIIVWITASWWCWYYGGGFGMRPLIDFYSFFILIIAIALKETIFILKGLMTLVMGCFIFFSQIAEFQYINNIFHWDQMNRQYFWHVFLRTDKRFFWYPHLQLERERLPKRVPLKIDSYSQELGNLEFENIQNNQIFKIESKLIKKKSDFGIKIQGKALIKNPDELFNVELFCFKNSDTIHHKIQYIGNQIRNLNSFEKFELDFYSNSMQKADSSHIIFRDFQNSKRIEYLEIQVIHY